MKKSIDLSTLKRRPVKEPVYTPREQVALDNADRVVARVIIAGEWKEKEWLPEPDKTLFDCLSDIQSQLRHSPDIRGVCLYIGGLCPNTKERMIAAVPHEWIPASVSKYLKKGNESCLEPSKKETLSA